MLLRVLLVSSLFVPWPVLANEYVAKVCNAYATQPQRVRCFEDNDLDFNLLEPVPEPEPVITHSDPAPSMPDSQKTCLAENCDPHTYWNIVEQRCPDIIERLAKWDYEWIDGWLEFKFDRQHYKTNDDSVYRFQGNKLKLQNGFGAWRRVTYYCDINIITGSIINAGAD